MLVGFQVLTVTSSNITFLGCYVMQSGKLIPEYTARHPRGKSCSNLLQTQLNFVTYKVANQNGPERNKSSSFQFIRVEFYRNLWNSIRLREMFIYVGRCVCVCVRARVLVCVCACACACVPSEAEVMQQHWTWINTPCSPVTLTKFHYGLGSRVVCSGVHCNMRTGVQIFAKQAKGDAPCMMSY
jgi:hypothetical protein